MSEEAKRISGPSLHPSAFTEVLPSEMPAEDIIQEHRIKEARRKRNDTENFSESDVAMSFRVVPNGLLETLDIISNQIGLHQSIITKCLSHHAMAWYSNSKRVSLLTRIYKVVESRSDGFPEEIQHMKGDDYKFVYPCSVNASVGSLRTVEFILGYFKDISKVLGIASYKLFLSGLCWSLSTNTTGWSKDMVSKYLAPERDNMLSYLGKRVLALDYVHKAVLWKRGDPAVVQYVQMLEEQEWL